MIIQHGKNVNYLNNGNDLYVGYQLNLNIVSSKRQTPLMNAAENGCYQICQLLIDNGADVKLEDMHG